MFYNITGKRHGVVETQRLIRSVSRLASFNHAVNLFLSVAAGFSKKNLVAIDSGSLDMLKTMGTVYFSDLSFDLVKNHLGCGQKLLHARNWGGV